MSERVYIVGGGPSLTGFDFAALPTERKIGANVVSWMAGCGTCVSIDRNFPKHYRDQLLAFKGRIILATPPNEPPIPRAEYWIKAADQTFSFAPNTLGGTTSGVAALNYAVQMGYTDIALIGMDYKWVGDQTHFHAGYGQPRQIVDRLAVWAKAFNPVAPKLAERGIRVVNYVGPHGSLVTAFPTAPLSEVLDHAT